MLTDDQMNLFKTAFLHIYKQGHPSMDVDVPTMCVYKGEENSGCAARPFIKEYVRDMEEKTWGRVVEKFPDKVDPVAAENKEFVEALQVAHDNAAGLYIDCGADFISEYIKNMKLILKAHGAAWDEVNMLIYKLQTEATELKKTEVVQ